MSTAVTPPALVPGTVVDGRYRVRAVTGEWRLGTAYRAEGRDGPVTLIISPLARGRSATFADWVRAEVERTRRVAGAGLLLIQDGGLVSATDGFLVVPAWSASSLIEDVRQRGVPAVDRACALVEAVARSVERAHAAGLILGDLRPASVLVPAGDHAAPLVLDLGLGRGLAGYLASPPTGAPAYTAPERAAGSAPAASDDLYALGALLFYLLSGRAPTIAPAGEARVVTPPSWLRADEGVAQFIDPIVLRAMAPMAADRGTARALALALAAVREVLRLSPAAREVLGLPPGATTFAPEPTSPHLLHDALGLGADDDAPGPFDDVLHTDALRQLTLPEEAPAERLRATPPALPKPRAP